MANFESKTKAELEIIRGALVQAILETKGYEDRERLIASLCRVEDEIARRAN